MNATGTWRLRRRVGRTVSSVFRARDAATAVAMYHTACEMLEGRCPRGGCGDPRKGRAGRPGIPRFPVAALEAPAHQHRLGADKPRDNAQVEGGAGVPLDDIADASGRHGHERAGRGMAGVDVLFRRRR